jgi:ADP-heptose:LPS heptosyltransferase
VSGREPVLVIKLGALGDMILAGPAFERIAKAHPGARRVLLTTPPFADLARAMPWFEAVWSDGRPRSLAGWLALIGRVRALRPVRVYDLQGNDRTNLLFQALRPFPPPWSGTAFGCALPHRNPGRMALHTLERQAEQLRDAGIWPDAPTSPGAAPAPKIDYLLRGERAALATPPLALLVPGASARRPEKRWPAWAFGELAAALVARGFDVAVVGAAQESPLARVILSRAPGARDLTGATDLPALARLGAAASVAVGNDTGPSHIVAAAGAPLVSLFSNASDPALCAPRGQVTVLREGRLEDLPVQTVLARTLALARPAAA